MMIVVDNTNPQYNMIRADVVPMGEVFRASLNDSKIKKIWFRLPGDETRATFAVLLGEPYLGLRMLGYDDVFNEYEPLDAQLSLTTKGAKE